MEQTCPWSASDRGRLLYGRRAGPGHGRSRRRRPWGTFWPLIVLLRGGSPRAPRLKAVLLRGGSPRAPRLKAPLLLLAWGLPHRVVAPCQEPKIPRSYTRIFGLDGTLAATRGVPMEVSIYRFNPETDKSPRMQDVTVDLPTDRDMMVLDLLEMLKASDPSLSYRRSCREGVCGSDGMNMNGKNGLACITPVSEVGKRGRLVVRPLPGLPVIRDLVVDMTQFYKQYERVKPYLINDSPPPTRNGCSRRKSGKSSMASMNASCAPAAPHRARLSGGTRTSSLVRRDCSRHIAFSPIAATPRRRSDLPNSKTRSACSVVAAS